MCRDMRKDMIIGVCTGMCKGMSIDICANADTDTREKCSYGHTHAHRHVPSHSRSLVYHIDTYLTSTF